MARWSKDEKGNSKEAGKADKKRKRRKPETEADWSTVDAGLLQDVIANLASDDGAVRFGYSRDGGAYSIGVYGDGKPYTEYLGATEDVNAWLEEFKLDFE